MEEYSKHRTVEKNINNGGIDSNLFIWHNTAMCMIV